MKIKKVLAFMLVTLLIVSFCGCKKNPPEASSTDSETSEDAPQQNHLTLLYSAADTFNPYTAKTNINIELCHLLYEPLIELDNKFNAVNVLANSVETQNNKCTVTIGEAKFSDGSFVTADDVVYSAKLALESANFASKLYEVTSVLAADSKTVVFNLSKNDPYFKNLLDFPILKQGSDKITNSDSVVLPPIGCGRYKLNEKNDGLVLNENYFGKKGNITQIKLINAPDSESVEHYVSVGAADIYYSSTSDQSIIRMSGNKFDINLNNLVYIGVNQNFGVLSHTELRQALSSGIDRSSICQNAFYNNALPAKGFFSPVWNETKSIQNIQINAASQITVENLQKIGYNSLSGNGKTLKLTMLVNSENRTRVATAQLIAAQLKAYGIEIQIIEKSYDKYLESLQNGNFQLFLGEIKLTENMDISPMVTPSGSAAFGIKTATAETADEGLEKTASAADVVNGFYNGSTSILDIETTLQTEMPFIPICYRTGVLFCNEKIENIKSYSASDIYSSIDSYIYNS
ncbi:MAG: ABC transporter substrate-binding protein [Ruminococcaceae bacterium]|nr:ABC transporter substrate-binding protein [Oscillospiraceae bacterium]